MTGAICVVSCPSYPHTQSNISFEHLPVSVYFLTRTPPHPETPNENPSLHIREKCFLGRYRYQPTKYAVVVVKLLQSDEMYPKVSDNTSGENPMNQRCPSHTKWEAHQDQETSTVRSRSCWQLRHPSKKNERVIIAGQKVERVS